MVSQREEKVEEDLRRISFTEERERDRKGLHDQRVRTWVDSATSGSPLILLAATILLPSSHLVPTSYVLIKMAILDITLTLTTHLLSLPLNLLPNTHNIYIYVLKTHMTKIIIYFQCFVFYIIINI